MLVDGTHFRIPQKGAAKKGNPFGSHKYTRKSALRYELGVDILMGNLVWIQGPYPAGAWPDIKIFNSCLAHFLEPYERIDADGYRGHAGKVKCPKNDVNPVENLKMQGHVRARHETLNVRLKNLGGCHRPWSGGGLWHCAGWVACCCDVHTGMAQCV